jgi:hypothetical protein
VREQRVPLHPELEQAFQFYRAQRAAPPAVFAHSSGRIPAVTFFGLDSLRRHLSNPLLTPDWLTLFANGNALSLETAAMEKRVQNKPLKFMDKTVIDGHLARGGALVLEGLDILEPPINDFVASIDAALPCSLSNCVAFLSQQGGEAYRGHSDCDDVLVIQIEGRKRWHIYAPQVRRYVGNVMDERALGPRVAEVMMEPGDVLYVRAGVPHRCDTASQYSLHLSFDLVDLTPNVQRISRDANARYFRHCAPAYATPAAVTEHYIALINSSEFQQELAQTTAQLRRDAIDLRKQIGKASRLTALDRFVPPKK